MDGNDHSLQTRPEDNVEKCDNEHILTRRKEIRANTSHLECFTQSEAVPLLPAVVLDLAKFMLVS